jgi:PKD repeat protein
MSKRYNNLKAVVICLTFIFALSCSEDETVPVPVANFTSAVDAANPLKVNFTNSSTNATTYSWDFGDGSAASTEANPSHTYEEGGDYTVTLTAVSAGGMNSKTAEVSVEEAEPVFVDVIEGGDMSDPDAWTIEGAGAPEQTAADFTDGKLVFSNGSNVQSNVKVYQAVEVVGGKEYTFSAKIKGAGATNSWVEILFGTEEPVADADYSNGKYTGLNTWNGCGGTAFEADLATFGCQTGDGVIGTGQAGKITFANSGTIYVVLKAGSWDGSLGAGGVEIDDVKLVTEE